MLPAWIRYAQGLSTARVVRSTPNTLSQPPIPLWNRTHYGVPRHGLHMHTRVRLHYPHKHEFASSLLLLRISTNPHDDERSMFQTRVHACEAKSTWARRRHKTLETIEILKVFGRGGCLAPSLLFREVDD